MNISGLVVGERKAMKIAIKFITISVMSTIWSGCQCFRVCPDVPKPPVLTAIHEPCYKHVRSSDPINQILECYMRDIVSFEKEAREREAALGAYK